MTKENTNETINAFCDCCDCQQKGTQEQLKLNGWCFTPGAEFCPNCND